MFWNIVHAVLNQLNKKDIKIPCWNWNQWDDHMLKLNYLNSRVGMNFGFLKKQRRSSCLWACMRCLKTSGITPCWWNLTMDARWSVTLQPGTWETERTSGMTVFFIDFIECKDVYEVQTWELKNNTVFTAILVVQD